MGKLDLLTAIPEPWPEVLADQQAYLAWLYVGSELLKRNKLTAQKARAVMLTCLSVSAGLHDENKIATFYLHKAATSCTAAGLNIIRLLKLITNYIAK